MLQLCVSLFFTKNFAMKIGNKLRGFRSEKGLSVLDIADRLGISESTYRRYESDKSFPEIPILEKLAKIYDRNFVELLPEGITITNTNNGEHSNGFAHIVNHQQQLSEKLVELYESRIRNLEELLEYWKNKNE